LLQQNQKKFKRKKLSFVKNSPATNQVITIKESNYWLLETTETVILQPRIKQVVQSRNRKFHQDLRGLYANPVISTFWRNWVRYFTGFSWNYKMASCKLLILNSHDTLIFKLQTFTSKVKTIISKLVFY
jgi:hypothetical protein